MAPPHSLRALTYGESYCTVRLPTSIAPASDHDDRPGPGVTFRVSCMPHMPGMRRPALPSRPATRRTTPAPFRSPGPGSWRSTCRTSSDKEKRPAGDSGAEMYPSHMSLRRIWY